ncbi:P1 family peptidase [Porticoccaceae bacterium]|nr:P1 family peptidase [Porticoccaceae bacterium]
MTDVLGLNVGYSTSAEIPQNKNQPKVQAGVTAMLACGYDPEPAYLWGGQHTLNGNGEMTGCHWLHDAGYFVSPICITNTHSVGMVHHATIQWMLEQYPTFFKQERNFVMPVIAETCDAILNGINDLHVKEQHVLEALNNASDGPVAEGNVGGGNGMITYEFKGGTGTLSRRITMGDSDYTVVVLVQSNFGARKDLTILGVPVVRVRGRTQPTA